MQATYVYIYTQTFAYAHTCSLAYIQAYIRTDRPKYKAIDGPKVTQTDRLTDYLMH